MQSYNKNNGYRVLDHRKLTNHNQIIENNN